MVRITAETLERRTLLAGLSGTAVLVNGLLDVVGTGATDPIGDDVIVVRADDGNITTEINGKFSTFASSRVSKVLVETGDEADDITIDSTVTTPTTIRGG